MTEFLVEGGGIITALIWALTVIKTAEKEPPPGPQFLKGEEAE